MSEYRAGLEEIKAIYATHAGMPVPEALNAFSTWFGRTMRRAREEERDRIAQAIERRKRDLAEGYADTARAMLEMGMEEAARIARQGGNK